MKLPPLPPKKTSLFRFVYCQSENAHAILPTEVVPPPKKVGPHRRVWPKCVDSPPSSKLPHSPNVSHPSDPVSPGVEVCIWRQNGTPVTSDPFSPVEGVYTLCKPSKKISQNYHISRYFPSCPHIHLPGSDYAKWRKRKIKGKQKFVCLKNCSIVFL